MKRLIEKYRESFYSWIRRRTRPLSIEEAEEKKLLWAKVYTAVTFVVFCSASYSLFSNIKIPTRTDLPEKIATAVELTHGDTVRVITLNGFSKVSDFTVSKKGKKNSDENKPHSDFTPENSNITENEQQKYI